MLPLDPEMNRGAGQGTPTFHSISQANSNSGDIAENLDSRQAPSALDLRIFYLARRFALNASLAEAFAVLVYGGLRT